MSPIVVYIVIANDIALPGPGDIDGISIGEQLHRLRNLIVFKEIVPGMIILFLALPTGVGTSAPSSAILSDLVATYGSATFAV